MKQISLAMVALLGAGLVACAPTVDRSNHHISSAQRNLMIELSPHGGMGATVAGGAELGLNVRTRTDGYLTVAARQPNGEVRVLLRDARIAGNETVSVQLPTTDLQSGKQGVRALFSKERPAAHLVTAGLYSEERWNAVGREFENLSAVDYDVQETYYFLR